MAASKAIQEEVLQFCRENLTHHPEKCDDTMAELYRKYHKRAFRAMGKQIELSAMWRYGADPESMTALEKKVRAYRDYALDEFQNFFNYVVEVCENEARSA